jgi:hypothetical protein
MVLRIRVFHYVVRCKGRFVISQTMEELDPTDRQKAFSSPQFKEQPWGPTSFLSNIRDVSDWGVNLTTHMPIGLVRR